MASIADPSNPSPQHTMGMSSLPCRSWLPWRKLTNIKHIFTKYKLKRILLELDPPSVIMPTTRFPKTHKLFFKKSTQLYQLSQFILVKAYKMASTHLSIITKRQSFQFPGFSQQPNGVLWSKSSYIQLNLIKSCNWWKRKHFLFTEQQGHQQEEELHKNSISTFVKNKNWN
jgi:hypothetical protein